MAEDGVKILYFILTRAQAHKDKEGMCLFIGENEFRVTNKRHAELVSAS